MAGPGNVDFANMLASSMPQAAGRKVWLTDHELAYLLPERCVKHFYHGAIPALGQKAG
jgi:hypothetical protein